MFFRPPSANRRYYRKGFRLPTNTLVWLLLFFLIGLFLHYGGRTKPVVSFWNDLRQAIGLGTNASEHPKPQSNPYKAPEPDNTDVATDNHPNEATDNGGTLSTDIGPHPGVEGVATDNHPPPPSASQAGHVMFEFEKQADFLLPARRVGIQRVRHEGFTIGYSSQYKNPAWVAYPLLAYETTGDAQRSIEQFKPDPSVEDGTALTSDYVRSGYDRGHMAPAADFKFSQRIMRETFFMSNITPQAPAFNRGIWKNLEDQVRAWAIRDNGLYVITGPVLTDGLPTLGRINEISIPARFYKVILYANKPNIRMIGFLMRNEGSTDALETFVTPVSQIERQTGLTFFPLLPDELAKRLKNKAPSEMIADWFY